MAALPADFPPPPKPPPANVPVTDQAWREFFDADYAWRQRLWKTLKGA